MEKNGTFASPEIARARRVLPVPGASMRTGVSSAKIAPAASTCRPMASASGASSAGKP